MNQWIKVRGDIIGIETYMKIELHYKDYLQQIFEAGGYCFLDQLKLRSNLIPITNLTQAISNE